MPCIFSKNVQSRAETLKPHRHPVGAHAYLGGNHASLHRSPVSPRRHVSGRRAAHWRCRAGRLATPNACDTSWPRRARGTPDRLPDRPALRLLGCDDHRESWRIRERAFCHRRDLGQRYLGRWPEMGTCRIARRETGPERTKARLRVRPLRFDRALERRYLERCRRSCER
jgi:hypothetical protein